MSLQMYCTMHYILYLTYIIHFVFAYNNTSRIFQGNMHLIGRKNQLLPLSVSRKCVSGTQWKITSTDSLFLILDELECLWAAALTPSGIPTGYLYGKLLQFTNTALINSFARNYYQGDYVFETQCFGKHHYISLVKFGGFSTSFGIWSINKFPYPIDSEEYYDNKEAIVMDFSIDLKNICRSEGEESKIRDPAFLNSMLPFQTGGYPMRLFIDLLRIVGCDKDGGILLLGKTFMLDPEHHLKRPYDYSK